MNEPMTDGLTAWKFLDERGHSPFSGFTWPRPVGAEPGPWVASNEAVSPCHAGIHACEVDDLAWWLAVELWEIELDQPAVRRDRKVVGPRGRLIRRVPAWPAAGDDYVEWNAWRTRDHAVEVLAANDLAETAGALAATTDLAAVGSIVADHAGEAITPVGIAAGLARGAATRPNPVLASHVAARAAGHAACWRDGDEATYYRAFADERVRQSRWLAERLGLAGGTGPVPDQPPGGSSAGW